MTEGLLNCAEILEDVCVVKFKIADDRHLGQVMNEFTALVKKGAVIFVAFNKKPFAVSKASTLAEIVRNSANQEAGTESIMLEQPRQKRGCGTLAADEELLQQFR